MRTKTQFFLGRIPRARAITISPAGNSDSLLGLPTGAAYPDKFPADVGGGFSLKNALDQILNSAIHWIEVESCNAKDERADRFL